MSGVADRLEEGRRGVLGRRRPEHGGKERAKRADLRRELAFLEPEVEVPLAPGVVVETGEHEPPLPPVRHEGEVIAAESKPAEHTTHHAAAPADPETRALVQEHREAPAALARPEMSRLHGLAGDRPPSPGGRDTVAARPRPGRGVEAADFLQHEGDEGRRGSAIADSPTPSRNRSRPLAELPFEMPRERSGNALRERREPRRVEEQAAVAKPIPTGQSRPAAAPVRGVQGWFSSRAKRTNRSRSRVTRGWTPRSFDTRKSRRSQSYSSSK